MLNNFSVKTYLILIILVASLLRLVALSSLPNGFSGDEAQQGYTAYSILKTGQDEWGETLPLFPRGFGDYKPPLYSYLAIPSIALFGLTVEAVRFPAAIVGIFTVLVTFFLTKKLLGSEKVALWSSFLLAISPWHIQLSRTAFEGGVGVLLFSAGLYFLLKADKKSLIFSAICLGLTLYSYHSFRLFVMLFLFSFLLYFRRQIFDKKVLLSMIIFIAFLLPLIVRYDVTLKRSADVGIFSQDQIRGFFESKTVSPIPYSIDRAFDNKFYFVADRLFDNYLSYFSLSFFFTGSRSDGSYLNFPMFGLLYPIEILFWLLAVYWLLKARGNGKGLLVVWFLLAPLPASLADGSMSANRTVTFLPLVSILSGIGASYLLDLSIRFLNSGRIYTKYFLTITLFIGLVFFLHYYLIKIPQRPPESLRYGYDQVFKKVWDLQQPYDNVVISKSLTEPQIFVAFYGGIDPAKFQQASQDWLRYEKTGAKYLDQMESWNYEKFLFEGINWKNKESKRVNALVVGKTEEFPEDIQALFEVKDSKGKSLFKLVETPKDEN